MIGVMLSLYSSVLDPFRWQSAWLRITTPKGSMEVVTHINIVVWLLTSTLLELGNALLMVHEIASQFGQVWRLVLRMVWHGKQWGLHEDL